MEVKLTFTDRGAQTVAFDMDATVPQNDKDINRPTPSAILAMAVKLMFENGMLATVGKLALEAASKKEDPAQYVKDHLKEHL